MTGATDGGDGRGEARRRTLTGGKIVYGVGAYSFDCTIREISRSGARIGIPGSVVIPKEFFLLDLKRETAFAADLVWRNGREAGVRFRAAHNLAHLSDPHLNYLRKLLVESRLR